MPFSTIYGDYVAPAVSNGGAWHIEGDTERSPLCGRTLIGGDINKMELHVSLLECTRCMKLGGEKFADQAEHKDEEPLPLVWSFNWTM